MKYGSHMNFLWKSHFSRCNRTVLVVVYKAFFLCARSNSGRIMVWRCPSGCLPVRPRTISFPDNNLWKALRINFLFGVRMQDMKTQIKFEFGIISLIPCKVMPLFLQNSLKLWFPDNNFWKALWIDFIFGMQVQHMKSQSKFNFGYIPLILCDAMAFSLSSSFKAMASSQ